ncbi:hypothetical protein [Pseudogemmobacter bohemicus]|uniref:hypothetical protein n=1 Tax=Pseudogemmobacter bohemicus TaxID=2250708 RepID=UPI000DD3EF83|nr:hypothetical protein [Pseudogemmobacter bohemicus]
MIVGREMFKGLPAEQWAGDLSYVVAALIRTARIALEADGGGGCIDPVRLGSVATTLEVAEEMQAVVIDGNEAHERARGLGIWKKEDRA